MALPPYLTILYYPFGPIKVINKIRISLLSW